MVASTSSSSNHLLLFAASAPHHHYAEHEHHPVRNNSSKRGFLIRSNNSINNHIRGTYSTGNLQERSMMLETVCPSTHTAAATFSSKNGSGDADFLSMKSSSKSSNSNSQKKRRCLSDGNLNNLLYVLDTVTAPPLPVSVASTDDAWFLGEEEEKGDIISDEEEKEDSISDEDEEEEDISTTITTETTTRPAETII
eukprot:CAMPEP_0170802708 /NCGR_PEP_ID=MMETSP0733-20121128/29475_1 /TAXON_ID=186038 /ORGANISM="Fragilariopsis kerguelensis, Strain L26-C5" /LENGTH=195 /DNA_ID=CAMNT_0011156029 /DNA_START=102 /DNA_END=686 /DNA_ORIENTATION=+